MSKKLDGLKIANEIAKMRGGKCLAERYFDINEKLLWECSNGHRWKSSLHKVKNHKSWCHECAGNKKLSIDIAKEIAKSRNGKCLSKEYKNNLAHLKWQCNKDHVWFASLSNTKSGSWCKECANTCKAERLKLENGINVARQIAKERDGKCLSKEYKNNATKLLWKCKYGHEWYANMINIKGNNRWCPECAQLKRAKSRNNSYRILHWKTGKELVCIASYEKAVVEYFNTNKINFRWQPDSFTMPNGRKYYPDCYLVDADKWIEIKGYFWGKSKQKWDWFHKENPNSELWDREKLKSKGII